MDSPNIPQNHKVKTTFIYLLKCSALNTKPKPAFFGKCVHMIVTSSIALKGAVLCYTKRSPFARKFTSGSALFMLTDQIYQAISHAHIVLNI